MCLYLSFDLYLYVIPPKSLVLLDGSESACGMLSNVSSTLWPTFPLNKFYLLQFILCFLIIFVLSSGAFHLLRNTEERSSDLLQYYMGGGLQSLLAPQVL